MHYLIDGQLSEVSSMSLSILDRGLLLGDGLFETIRVLQGEALNLNAHWSRLSDSANKISMALPFTRDEFISSVHRLLEANQLENAGIRVTLTRGLGERGLLPTHVKQGRAMFQAFPLTPPAKSVNLMLSTIRSNQSSPLVALKSISKLESVLVKQEAFDAGFDDGLRLNGLGEITETSCANFFLQQGGKVITPPTSCGLLAGVMRQRLIRYFKTGKINVVEEPVCIEQIRPDDSAFMCNVLIGVVPVNRIGELQLAQSLLVSELSQEFYQKYTRDCAVMSRT